MPHVQAPIARLHPIKKQSEKKKNYERRKGSDENIITSVGKDKTDTERGC